jgi:hypothetical protein
MAEVMICKSQEAGGMIQVAGGCFLFNPGEFFRPSGAGVLRILF